MTKEKHNRPKPFGSLLGAVLLLTALCLSNIIAADNSPVDLILFVEEAGTYFGFDLTVVGTGGMELVSFAADPNASE